MTVGKFHGASAIVSGGAGGLGEATVRRLHAEGLGVVIADLAADKGKALADELGDRASFVSTARLISPPSPRQSTSISTAPTTSLGWSQPPSRPRNRNPTASGARWYSQHPSPVTKARSVKALTLRPKPV
jgi:shikimate 5-dehydrogenase